MSAPTVVQPVTRPRAQQDADRAAGLRRCQTDMGYALAEATGIAGLQPPVPADASMEACVRVMDGLTPANHGDFLGPDGGQMPF